MVTIACVLYRGEDIPEHSRGIFSPQWVDRLYRGVSRNLSRPFRFVCYVDEPYEFEEEGVEARPLVMSYRNMFSMLECYREDLGRVLFMGLDTLITGSLDALAAYEGPFAMTRDPYRPEQGCSGVVAYPYTPEIWEAFERDHEQLGRSSLDHGFPSDMPYLRRFMSGQPYLDDLYPGQLKSYKVHVLNEGLGDARIVYFHGVPKPHQIRDQVLLRHWI